MSIVDQILPVMREALCQHEVLRRLRFPAENIYAALDYGVMLVVLRYDGKEFISTAGYYDRGQERFDADWRFTARAWNELLTEEERIAMLNVSAVMQHKVEFINAIRSKGFDLSCPGSIATTQWTPRRADA